MPWKRHDPESRGSYPRDLACPRRLRFKTAHRNWRVWVVAVVLIVLMLVYTMTENEALIPGHPSAETMPAMDAP